MSIRIVQESIINLETDAIVNAANENLWEGGGVCGAIFKAAGRHQLRSACDKIGYCDVGSAVLTDGFNMKAKYIITDNPPDYGDADSVLGLLYECFNENNPYDNEQIKADFEELYRQMNGMPLREMDQIVYPVCRLCRDHERVGFVEGIKIGIRLQSELAED